ncbi:Membrane protein with DUF350 domain, partial [Pseudomonas sp. FEN]
ARCAAPVAQRYRGIRLHHLYGGGGGPVRVVSVHLHPPDTAQGVRPDSRGQYCRGGSLGWFVGGVCPAGQQYHRQQCQRRGLRRLGPDRRRGAVTGVCRDQSGAQGAVRAYRARRFGGGDLFGGRGHQCRAAEFGLHDAVDL